MLKLFPPTKGLGRSKHLPPLLLVAIQFVFFLILGGALVHAQAHSQAPDFTPESQDQTTKVKQSLFLDPTGKLDFEAARAANYLAFNALERLPLQGKVAWFRLNISNEAGSGGPIYMRLLPVEFENVELFSPDANSPNGWRSQTLLGKNLITSIPVLGELPAGPVYLRVKSPTNSNLIAIFGQQEEIQKFDQKLGMLVMGVTTILGIFFLQMLWRTLFHFKSLYLVFCFLLPSIIVKFWITLGYAQSLVHINASHQPNIPHVIVLNIFGGIAFILLACEIFPASRWLKGLWIWVPVSAFNLLFSFFQPESAALFDNYWKIFGIALFLLSCIVATIASPAIFRALNTKLTLLLLMSISLIVLFISTQAKGLWSPGNDGQSTNIIFTTICIRVMVPVGMIGISIWIFEKLRLSRLKNLQYDLENSRQTLELELKRLERQKQFTAMLAHEIKNPLIASHLALADIENRLAVNTPIRQSTLNIKASLLDIDAIIDRCVEIDGYEHGEMPMTASSFTLEQLIDFIRANNPDKRIYTVIEGLAQETLIHSDLQYLKIILGNLLSNALKYSERGSLVELKLSRGRDDAPCAVVFCVSNVPGDAGIPDALRLFERYYRADGARSQSGAGLGLWLAQSLASVLSTRIQFHNSDNRLAFSFPLVLS